MRRAYLLAFLSVLTTGLMLVAHGRPLPIAAQAESDGWSTRAPMLASRSEMSIVELDGRIYALGGYPGTRVTSADVQVYDSWTDSWTAGPPLPLPLHHTMAAAVDGRLYLIGGEAGNPAPGESVFQDRVYMLDEVAGEWVSRAPMPTARSGGGAGVIDGKIYVAGGRPPHGHDFAVYDPWADAWTLLPDLPTGRNHLGVAAIDGRLYVAGGRFGGGVGSEMTDVLEIYDPSTTTWTSGAPMLAPRAGVAAVAANGCLYVIGGEGNEADPRGIFDRNEAYDPATNTWHALAPMPLPTHGLTGAAFLDGWIHLPGGATRRGVSGANVTVEHQVFRADLICGPLGSTGDTQ
ncbi:MAG: kelch-like protein [Chloroflexota bacterium]|nr:kelch-like protein [Chloroflexota bacterium]